MYCVGPFGFPQEKHIKWGNRDSQLSHKAEKGRGLDPAITLTCSLTDSIYFKVQNFSLSYFSLWMLESVFHLSHFIHHISSIRFLSCIKFPSGKIKPLICCLSSLVSGCQGQLWRGVVMIMLEAAVKCPTWWSLKWKTGWLCQALWSLWKLR